MKLQLNEKTLNAYINEAIKQEMNEGWEKLGKFGGKAKNILKGTTKGVKNYGKALGGNKKAIKKANSKISDIDTELKKIHSAQDANIKAQANVPDWDKNLRDKLGKEGWSLVDQERALTKGKNALTTKLNQAKAGKTLARTATGAAVAGLGAGYLAGRSRNGGQDPNAPWNDENNDPGMNDDVQNDTGGNEINGGGFDGTFPWDNIEPQWAPRRPRPQVQQPTQPVQPQQPATVNWVDLGLPSGTLWADCNGTPLGAQGAVSLPTRKDIEELKQHCKQSISEDGNHLILTAPNGNTLTLEGGKYLLGERESDFVYCLNIYAPRDDNYLLIIDEDPWVKTNKRFVKR